MSFKASRKAKLRVALKTQLEAVGELGQLEFDNPCYGNWRAKTGGILDEVFGYVGHLQHPCTLAFLNYDIPRAYSASDSGMQELYENILTYQAELLQMYLEDLP
jgi:hypothetical protein